MAKKRANGEGNIRKRADGRWEGRPQATTPKQESASSKMYLVKRRRNARQSSVPQWRLPEESMSAVRMSTR